METNAFDWFKSVSNTKPEGGLRPIIAERVKRELEIRATETRFSENVAADIVMVEDEMLRARIELKAGRDKNEAYPAVLGIVIDEMRRGLRSHAGESMVGLSVFLGLRTQAEEEHRQVSRLTKVVKSENSVVITEIKKTIKDAIPEIANLTVETLRKAKQRSGADSAAA